MMLAEKLIAENLETKNPYLDLGSCNLNGTEKVLEKLEECRHLQTLVLANQWLASEDDENIWITSNNRGLENALKKVPLTLPPNIAKLIVAEQKEIENYDFLGKLKKLEELDLSFTNIGDLRPIQELKYLRILYLHESQIKDLTPLQNLEYLEILYLVENQIQDLTPLQNLKNLQEIDLSYNLVSDLTPLQGLPKLHILDLSENAILEIASLKNLPALEILDLTNNGVQEVEPLSKLQSLQELYISSNQIQDFTALQNLHKLKKIALSNNPSQDISALKKLTKLEILHLHPWEFISLPPIWFAYLKAKGGTLGDYLHLSEVQAPFTQKVWQLMKSKNEKDIELARQLAENQGWLAEDFNAYLKLLYN